MRTRTLHDPDGVRRPRVVSQRAVGGRGVPLNGRALVLGVLALLVSSVPGAVAAGGWAPASTLGTDATYIHVAATGTDGSAGVALGEHANATSDAWLSQGVGRVWAPVAVPAGWTTEPADRSTGQLDPRPGLGCRAPSVARAPDGHVLALCQTGSPFHAIGPSLTAGVLAPGGAGFDPVPVPLFVLALLPPELAIAGDGTLVASLAGADESGHPDCDGYAWRGPALDPARWSYLPAAGGQWGSVGAARDGSAIVATIAGHCDATPAGLPRVAVSARRGTAGSWTAATLARNIGGSTFAAVADHGRIVVAWQTGGAIGSAVREAGSARWVCRPVLATAPCVWGNARDRAQRVGPITGVRPSRVYGLVALPDATFVLVFSGRTRSSALALYAASLLPRASRWSHPRLLDTKLFESPSTSASFALGANGTLLAAWAHRLPASAVSLRVARIDPVGPVTDADLGGAGIPIDPTFAGSSSLLWIDDVAAAGAPPMGRLLVSTASAPRT